MVLCARAHARAKISGRGFIGTFGLSAAKSPRWQRAPYSNGERCLGPRIYRRFCRSGFDDEKAAAVTQLGLLRPAWRLKDTSSEAMAWHATNVTPCAHARSKMFCRDAIGPFALSRS